MKMSRAQNYETTTKTRKNGVPRREEDDISRWIFQLQSTEDLLNLLIYNDVIKIEHEVMNTFLWRSGLFIQSLT